MSRHAEPIILIVLAFATVTASAQKTAAPNAPVSALSAPENKPNPLRYVTPDQGYEYFSGYEKNNHNLPAIYAYQGEIQKLVVIGRGYRAEFPISQTDQAFDAYRALLKKNGYKIDDHDNGRSPLMTPAK